MDPLFTFVLDEMGGGPMGGDSKEANPKCSGFAKTQDERWD
jgi:hypothetical protein